MAKFHKKMVFNIDKKYINFDKYDLCLLKFISYTSNTFIIYI